MPLPGGEPVRGECTVPLHASRTIRPGKPHPEMPQGEDEREYLIVPHEVATGADCDGCLMVEERGDVADLRCNSCGSMVDTVPIRGAGTRLMELASVEICSAQCPHCGAMNTFRGVSVIEAFVCRERGEGVSIERPVP